MESLLGSDSVALRRALVALALGAATLVLIIRGATIRRRPARVALRSQPPRRAAAIATLEAVYRRGDITHEDYVELSRRLRGRWPRPFTSPAEAVQKFFTSSVYAGRRNRPCRSIAGGLGTEDRAPAARLTQGVRP